MYDVSMEVGIRELKSKLSEYLGRVSDGEELVITDRGTPVARVIPFADTTLQRGFEEGWVEAPRRQGLAPFVPMRGSAAVMSVLDDDRGA